MRSQVQDTYARWKEKQQEFLKNLKYYKENTIPLQSLSSSAPQGSFAKKSKSLVLSSAKASTQDVWLIPRAFEVPVRDQAKRPTCAAFAGIRPTNFSWRKMALMLIYQSNISIGSASQTVPPDHVMTKVPGFWRPLNKRIIRENPFLRNKTALMSTPVYLAMKRKFP